MMRDCRRRGAGLGREDVLWAVLSLPTNAASHFEKAIGVDIAPSMIETVRSINRVGTRCTYERNTRDDPSLFADASFDRICPNITLTHVPPSHVTSYVGEMIRTLKPDGVLVFQLKISRAAPTGRASGTP